MASLAEIYAGAHTSAASNKAAGTTAGARSAGSILAAQYRRKLLLEKGIEDGKIEVGSLGPSDKILIQKPKININQVSGGDGKSVGGFLANFGKSIWNTAKYFPSGIYQLGKAFTNATAFASTGGMSGNLHDIGDLAGGLIKHYKDVYGPGGGSFWENFYNDPLSPVLDALSVVSLGSSGAASGGRALVKAGSESSLAARAARITARDGRAPITSPKLGENSPLIAREFTPRPIAKAVQLGIDWLTTKSPSVKQAVWNMEARRAQRLAAAGKDAQIYAGESMLRDSLGAMQKLSPQEAMALTLAQRGIQTDRALDFYQSIVHSGMSDAEKMQKLENLGVDPRYVDFIANASPEVRELLRHPTENMILAHNQWVKDVEKMAGPENLGLDPAMRADAERKVFNVLNERARQSGEFTPLYHGTTVDPHKWFAEPGTEFPGDTKLYGADGVQYPFHAGSKQAAAERLNLRDENDLKLTPEQINDPEQLKAALGRHYSGNASIFELYPKDDTRFRLDGRPDKPDEPLWDSVQEDSASIPPGRMHADLAGKIAQEVLHDGEDVARESQLGRTKHWAQQIETNQVLEDFLSTLRPDTNPKILPLEGISADLQQKYFQALLRHEKSPENQLVRQHLKNRAKSMAEGFAYKVRNSPAGTTVQDIIEDSRSYTDYLDRLISQSDADFEHIVQLVKEGKFHGIKYRNTVEDKGSISAVIFDRRRVSQDPLALPDNYPIKMTYVPTKRAEGLTPYGKGKLGTFFAGLGKRSPTWIKDTRGLHTQRTQVDLERLFHEPKASFEYGSTGETFLSGAARMDSSTYIEHALEARRYVIEKAYKMEQVAKWAAKDKDGEILRFTTPEMMREALGEGWTLVNDKFPVAWFMKEQDLLKDLKAVLDGLGEHPHGNVDEMIDQLLQSNADAFVKQHWGAMKQAGVAVPTEVAKYQERLAQVELPYNNAASRWIARQMYRWRTLTLTYMPRWALNTAVGSFLMSMVRGVNPRDVAIARRWNKEGIFDYIPGVNLKHQPMAEAGDMAAVGYGNRWGQVYFRQLFGAAMPTRFVMEKVQGIEDYFRRAQFVHNLRRESALSRAAKGPDIEFEMPKGDVFEGGASETKVHLPERTDLGGPIHYDWREQIPAAQEELQRLQAAMDAVPPSSPDFEALQRQYFEVERKADPNVYYKRADGSTEYMPKSQAEDIVNDPDPTETYDIDQHEFDSIMQNLDEQFPTLKPAGAVESSGAEAADALGEIGDTLASHYDELVNQWGGNLAEALQDPKVLERTIQEVNKFAYNYSILGPFERRYLRQFVPFWGWYKFISMAAWRMGVEMPGRVNFMRALGEMGRQNEEAYGPIPDWIKGSLIFNIDDKGNIHYLPTMGLNPFGQIANPLAPGGAVQNMLQLGQLNPGIQGMLSAWGLDPLTGQEVRISPQEGVGRDFYGGLRDARTGEPTKPVEHGALRRFLMTEARAIPQFRLFEKYILNQGGSTYPESVPFIAPRPMAPAEAGAASGAGAAAGAGVGILPRSYNLLDYQRQQAKTQRYVKTRQRNDLRKLKRKFSQAGQ